MKHADLLKSLGRTPQEMGTSVQQKISQYNRLEKGIEKLRTQLGLAKTDAKKQSLIEEIQSGEIALADFDDTICEAIKKYNKNFESNKRKGNKLNAAKKPAAQTEPPVEPGEPPVETTPTETFPQTSEEPPVEEVVPTEETPSPATEPVKKKNSFALVGGLLLLAVAAITGVAIYDANKN